MGRRIERVVHVHFRFLFPAGGPRTCHRFQVVVSSSFVTLCNHLATSLEGERSHAIITTCNNPGSWLDSKLESAANG